MEKHLKGLLDRIEGHHGWREWLRSPVQEFRHWMRRRRVERILSKPLSYSSLRAELIRHFSDPHRRNPFHPGWVDPFSDIDPEVKKLIRSGVRKPGRIIIVSNPDGNVRDR